MNHVAELCVIDEEFDTTVYHLSMAQPNGNQLLFSQLDANQREHLVGACQKGVEVEGGYFVKHAGAWPLPAVGLQHFSGRYLRGEEYRYLVGRSEQEDNLYAALVNAGLLLRPGFKYGCRWRAYEEGIEVAHAPWLVQPESEAPQTWEEVCLAVRLAEGVNKRWICARQHDDGYSFLNIKRIG